jgi:outer membrane protein assembly factor BamB
VAAVRGPCRACPGFAAKRGWGRVRVAGNVAPVRAVNRIGVLGVVLLGAIKRLPTAGQVSPDDGMWCQMGTNIRIRMAGRGLLAAAALAGLACLGVAAPATASSRTAPRIHSVRPAHGAAGTKVTITGSGFTRVTAVLFRGVAAAFKVRSRSRITAAVPAMPSAAGRITVTTRAGTARSRARFTVTPRIVLSPATGPPGSVVTVSGTGFGAIEGADIFAGTTDEALASTGPAGSFGPVRVTVPVSAVPGTAWISAKGRHSGLFARAAFTVNTNWPQFGFSLAHTGTNPYENVLSASDVARLGLDWRFPASVSSSTAVANGVVYAGSDDGHVYALNAATGAKLWSFRTAGVVVSSPAVANGVVYVGSFDNLYALNAATGAGLWSFRAGPVVSSPAVAGGVVYFGDALDNVYALNAATGTRLWSFRAGSSVNSSPAVAGGVVYIGSDDHNVYALDAATGAKLWTFTTGSRVGSPPAVANGVVYIGSGDHKVYAFGLPGGLAALARPNRNSLYPDYNLPQQR